MGRTLKSIEGFYGGSKVLQSDINQCLRFNAHVIRDIGVKADFRLFFDL